MRNSSTVYDAVNERLLLQVADEILNCRNRGAHPDIDAYVSQYPEIAGALRKMFTAPDSASSTHISFNVPAARAESPTAEIRQLGDFQILREAGRGGMGVVYEAHQISLNRRVALKVLPFIAVLDSRRLRRFQKEAQAAAQLHHDGIVPVYSIGSERGVHYFAMQFIDGQTLAQIIHDLRVEFRQQNGRKLPPNPISQIFNRTTIVQSEKPAANERAINSPVELDCDTTEKRLELEQNTKPFEAIKSSSNYKESEFFRSAAKLGVQAAQALEHAHSNGVVHRDVKPANLLVDETLTLWVTDFGLAHFRVDDNLTMTGDLMGTLRYMSPEQALAKRVGIDHRTDIYSLGATLYELLTLEPVFQGNDRQDILRQIAFEEPRPLRKIRPSIPVELETIVLKSLSKNPDERYVTAQEFADDLQRFLKDEPVRAKRHTWMDIAQKWLRRHPAFVAVAGIMFCLSTIVLGVSNVLIALERDAKVDALHAMNNALAKAENAEVNEAERRKEAEKERERAEANFRRAREAVDRVFTRVAEKMADQPQMELIRRALLEDALEFYQSFLKEKGNDPSIRLETAKAYSRVGAISEMLGRHEQSEKATKEAIALLTGLARDYPAMREYNDELLECQASMAWLFQQMHNRADDHVAMRRTVLQLAEKRVAGNPTIPSYAQRLVTCHVDMANALLENQPAEAEKHCRIALELNEKLKTDFPGEPETPMITAFCHHWLGRALSAQRKYIEAEVNDRLSAESREKLLNADPNNIGLQSDLAHVQSDLANVLVDLDRFAEAEKVARNSVRLAEKIAEDFPYVLENRRRLSNYYDSLVNVLTASGRTQEAIEAVKKCISIRQKVATEFPTMLWATAALGSSEYKLGLLLNETGSSGEAIDYFRKAESLLEEAIKNRPNGAVQINRLAWFFTDCPAVQFRNPERAVQISKKSLQLSPTNARYWTTLGMAQYRTGNFADSAESHQRSIELQPVRGAFDDVCVAMTYWKLGQKEKARELFDRGKDKAKKTSRNDEKLRRYIQEAESLFAEAKVN